MRPTMTTLAILVVGALAPSACDEQVGTPEWFNCMPPSPRDVAQIAIDCPYSGLAY